MLRPLGVQRGVLLTLPLTIALRRVLEDAVLAAPGPAAEQPLSPPLEG